MATTLKLLFGASSCLSISSLLIGTLLYTIGYLQQEAAITDVLSTQCINDNFKITLTTCNYLCNCQELCSGMNDTVVNTSNTTIQCNDVCDECSDYCFSLACVFYYEINSGMNYTITVPQTKIGNPSDYDTAYNYLNEVCPVGQSTTCYYYQSNPSQVMSSINNPMSIYIGALFFFALMAITYIMATAVGITWAVFSINVPAKNANFDSNIVDENDLSIRIP